MNKAADLVEESRDDGGKVIRLSGTWSIACLHDMPNRLDAISGPIACIDVADIDHMDTIGAWTIHRTAKRLETEVCGGSTDCKRLIGAVGKIDEPVDIRPTYVSPFNRVLGQIGEAVINSVNTLVGLLGFFGGVLVTVWGLIRHPSRFRINAVVQRFEVVGVSALGIIGLMSFLIGIVIAQQGAV